MRWHSGRLPLTQGKQPINSASTIILECGGEIMNAARLYALTWIIFAAALLAAYVSHSLSPAKLIIFSFLGSTLFFMGLVVLIPYLVDRHYESKQLVQVGKERRES